MVLSRSSAEAHRLRQLRLVAEVLELERLQMVPERLHEPLGRINLAEVGVGTAVGFISLRWCRSASCTSCATLGAEGRGGLVSEARVGRVIEEEVVSGAWSDSGNVGS